MSFGVPVINRTNIRVIEVEFYDFWVTKLNLLLKILQKR